MTRRSLALVMLLALVSTACQVRIDTVVRVNEDESGTFALEMALDEELRELSSEQGGGIDLADGMDRLPAGWSVEDFVDGEFEGTRIETSFADFADLDAKLDVLRELGEADQSAPNELINNLEFAHDGDTFTFRAELAQLTDSFADSSGGGFGLEGIDPSQLLESLFLVRFVVELPGTLGDNNADSIDGNRLSWVVPLDGEDRILFAESNPGGGLFSSPIVLAAAAVLLAALVGWAMYRRRQDSTETPTLEPASAVAAPDSSQSEAPVDGDPFAL